MSERNAASIRLRFPGDLDYIPPIRKFVSETLLAKNFDTKFTFRSEIIVDEICNNAVLFGCKALDAQVELEILVGDERIEFVIRDPGESPDDLIKLKAAMSEARSEETHGAGKLGMEIVKMLSEEVDIKVDDKNLTTVRVVRRRETSDGEARSSGSPSQQAR